jgi:hypothetical protein
MDCRIGTVEGPRVQNKTLDEIRESLLKEDRWRATNRRLGYFSRGLKTKWRVEHRNIKGELLYSEEDIPNILHDEGEQAILSAYFDTDLAGFGAPPASLHMGLRTNASAEGDTLASGLTEVSGTGYGRGAVSTTTGFTLSQVGGDYRATSTNVVFTATGTWTGAVALFLCTVTSGTAGKLIASIALSTTRTLVNGDTLTVSCYVVASE